MALRDKLQQSIRQSTAEQSVQLPSIRDMVKNLILQEVAKFKNEIMHELQTILQDAVGEDGALALKGERGFTPQRGVDFLTNEELEAIKKEITPIKGKHYFDGRHGIDGRDGRSPSLKEIHKIVAKILADTKTDKTPEQIARALESLIGKAKIDYHSLRNLPYIPKEVRATGRMRGGGDIVEIQDLTGSTDGSTKVFTVNRHIKALMVVSTQFPYIYRPTTDFTRTSTQLTLTDAVGVPQSGQTLLFLYVA